ncbi:MAG: orc1/cdc6 family replication initiation protein [Aigarchaeota archaeon]|nr:orc1/cdc6 family replication initiation protein [Aigarchaeota archaeon]MCX8202851.1 orc1/cdc6 family replication initiation protein [Nitrososphaeria archaeon]MDW8043873.1 orc1/cdc6 family replication initiation protein [Nitrososphaerota archaeon]
MERFQLKVRGREDPLEDLIRRTLDGKSPFKNRDVLRSDYIPENLPHRWEHVRRLGEILSPSLRMVRPSNVFVYGKTGTGKTAVAKHVLKRFSQEAERQGLDLRFVYVNCRLSGTEYRVISELCGALGVKVPFTGLSKAEVLSRFRNALYRSSSLVIACLDEIDHLVKTSGDEFLYALTRINEGSEGGQLSLIGISNDLTFKEMLDPRVLSSLSEEEIVFHPYTAVELVDILSERASMALHEGAISEGVIQLCAALAAAEHGDARRAIDLLRVAAELAEREGSAVVEERHVREAYGVIEQGRVYEALSTLPLHGRAILLAVYQCVRAGVQRITTGLVYAQYRKICEHLGIEPLTDRRVSSILSELGMLGVITSDVVSYGRYGRTRRISLNIPVHELEEVLLHDDALAGALDVPLNQKEG